MGSQPILLFNPYNYNLQGGTGYAVSTQQPRCPSPMLSYGPHPMLEMSQEKARWMLMLHGLAGLVWRGRVCSRCWYPSDT